MSKLTGACFASQSFHPLTSVHLREHSHGTRTRHGSWEGWGKKVKFVNHATRRGRGTNNRKQEQEQEQARACSRDESGRGTHWAPWSPSASASPIPIADGWSAPVALAWWGYGSTDLSGLDPMQISSENKHAKQHIRRREGSR
jgi:hypothetical protein